MNRFLFFLLTLVTSTYSQILHVNYDVQIDLSGTSLQPYNHKYILTNSNGKSVQKKFFVGSVPSKTIDKNGQSSRVIKIGDDTTYVYKNFIKNSVFSEERIFTKVFYVMDELNVFSWKIEKDTLTILNHKCQKATTTFRGREFVAYFADDIPISDGPEKFNGLPGLILKVMIVNSASVFSVEATEIRFEKSTKEIANAFDSRKITAFKDFKKEYNRKYAELESFSGEQSADGSSFAVHRGGLELLSDD